MTPNPFDIVKAEEFNHGFHHLAHLMHFGASLAGRLLSASNVFLDGSRGSGKSMYLRLMSLQAKTIHEQLATQGTVEPLPQHKPFLGVYMKLAPTSFGPHEHESQDGFLTAFQEFFNLYAMECLTRTVSDCLDAGLCQIDRERKLAGQLSEIARRRHTRLRTLWRALRTERHTLRQQLNSSSYTAGDRAQPDILWDYAEALSAQPSFAGQRVHLLIDEYDSLSDNQQRVLNTYLRKRDFPLTFKIACRKHRLVTHDIHDRPLNPSGDYTKVQLDDERLGLGENFASYLESIANKRLQNAGLDTTIRELLGQRPPRPRPKAQRRYGGFEQLVVLSSGIVRTFLELCRDIYSEAPTTANWPVAISTQDRVIKAHAGYRWNSVSTDRSARPELQHLVEQVAQLFKRKARDGAESQIIRLEIVDFENATAFLRELLDSALDYEAFIKPNQERLQKNSAIPSTGYLLHRLLCVHFRLEPESRWDFEITSTNLERLITQPDSALEDVLRRPTKRRTRRASVATAPLFTPYCPVMDAPCDISTPAEGRGFLSCRLPKAGTIRDAIALIKDAFASMGDVRDYEVFTAEDYPATGDIACKVCSAVSSSSFVLVELSRYSPSVAMELGFCLARGVLTYVLFNQQEQPHVEPPFSSIEYLSYSVTPDSVAHMVAHRLVPFLRDSSGRGTIVLGPGPADIAESPDAVFVALPDEAYCQETLLPAVQEVLEERGLRVTTPGDGRALQDLQRAAIAIAGAKYCLVDTTHVSAVRAMYLGMALGYSKRFANLINRELDGETAIFTNARAKSVFEYHDKSELIQAVQEFLERVEGGHDALHYER